MSVEEIRNKILPLLKAHGATRAGLFGSAAKGEMRPDSDIDVLIEISNDMNLLDFIKLKQQLEDRLSRRVDLVEYKALKSRLKKAILNDHVALL